VGRPLGARKRSRVEPQVFGAAARPGFAHPTIASQPAARCGQCNDSLTATQKEAAGSLRDTGNREKDPNMSKFYQSVANFLVKEDGPTAVEYAVMLALIIVVCIAAITTLGNNAKTTFTSVGTTIGGAS
jgi:pilus assembly protein Flp/PilA